MATDFFLKLDSITGESADTNHTGEITVHSFSWGATQVSSVSGSGGSGAGKAHLAELSIMKTYDSASVPLFKALLSGTHIVNGILSANKAGGAGKPYLKVTLGELFVTSIQASGSTEIPMESVSFSYNTIKVEYFKQNEQGVLTAAGVVNYDVKANKVS